MHQIYIYYIMQPHKRIRMRWSRRVNPLRSPPTPSPAIIVCWKGNVKATPEPTQPEHQRTCVLRYVVVANVG